MKLYDCATAPSPRRARMFIAEKRLVEKGVTVERIEVDLAAGEHLLPAFQAINPARTVPVLELADGTRIAENAGIAAYLEAAFPDPPLLGRTPAEKGLVAGWNARMETEGILAVSEGLRNRARSMQKRAVTGARGYSQIPELAVRGRERTLDFFAMLDQHLAGRDYIALDAFSIADITAFVAVEFASWIKVNIDPRQQNLLRWHREIASRPAASA